MNLKELPEWFKEKYEVELSAKDPQDYWIRLSDVVRLLKEQHQTKEDIKQIFSELRNTRQFACLESWCQSRKSIHEDGLFQYCDNCKRLNELEKKWLVKR